MFDFFFCFLGRFDVETVNVCFVFFWEALLKVFRSPNDTREICKKKKKSKNDPRRRDGREDGVRRENFKKCSLNF